MARPGRIFGREPRAEELPIFPVTGAGRAHGGHSGSAHLGAATPEPVKLPLTHGARPSRGISCRASAAWLGVGAVLRVHSLGSFSA